jgi:PKD repeat protein
MKRLNFLTFGIAAMFAAAVMFNSCAEDPDPVTPTLQFIAEVDGYDVTITAEATDAETWLWDYGDGNTAATMGSHSYSYEDAGSGSYTITCIVTSKDDLTATKTASVTIAASIEEIIAGVGDEGKTWVLTQSESTYIGKVGGGGVTNDLAIYPEFSLVPNGMLTASLPLASIPGASMTDATWSLSYADKTFQWYDEFVTADLAQTTFTFPEDDPVKIAELVISEGAYVCIKDLYYPEPYATALQLPGPSNNALFILKEVTADMMNIAVAINSWPDYAPLPSLLLHLVLVPKQ